MSVVAGCSLLDGVILGADCRVTYTDSRGGLTYRDTVQKVIAITPQSAIGFVGDVTTASDLIGSMLKNCHRMERYNPVTLRNWLPRYFRHRYAHFKGAREVTFLVGSVIHDRPNIVETRRAWQIVQDSFASRPQGSINHLSSNLHHILSLQSRYVVLSDEPMGMLYTMRSPDFTPGHYNPLDFVAIGSGHEMKDFIGQVSDQIFSGVPMQHGDASWLTRSMNHFLRTRNIESVGGMFPMIKLSKTGAMHITRQTGRLPNGPLYELAHENDRWVQRNVTTGEELRLELPWELDQTIRGDQRFDDLRPSMI
jgi:hypothetical protein